MNADQEQTLAAVGNAQVEEQQRDVGRDLLKSWRGSPPADEKAAAERRAYFLALHDGAADRAHAQAQAAQSDPFAKAVGQHANIHEAAFSEAPAADEVTPGKDFDEAQFADSLGLTRDEVARLDYPDAESAVNHVAEIFDQLESTVSDHEAAAHLASLGANQELSQRLANAIDAMRSPHYGRAGQRSALQQRRTLELVLSVSKQAIALERQGLAIPQIETLVRRSRAISDPSYSFKRGQVASTISTAGKFRNIHEAHIAFPK